MSTSTILYPLYMVAFTQLVTVLSQDLCSISTIDSIAYIKNSKQYFLTSGRSYWIVKENEMTPRAGKRLHTLMPTVDTAIYMDFMSDCEHMRPVVNTTYNQRHVILLARHLGANLFLIFDMRSNNFYLVPALYTGYGVISTLHLQWGQTVDAMFNFPPNDVYAIQGNRYAGADWSNMCGDPHGKFSSPYTTTYDAKVDFETNRRIDATMFKDGEGIYVFTGDQYYVLQVDMQRSGRMNKGKIERISKGAPKSIKQFLKCDGTGPIPTGGPVETDGPEPPPGPPTGGENTENPVGKPEITEPPAQESNEEKKKSPMLWIIIGVILLIIVIAIIAILVFLAMRRKKQAEQKSQKTGSAATAATSRKSASGSKMTPSKFDRMAAKSTTSSKHSKRSKWNA